MPLFKIPRDPSYDYLKKLFKSENLFSEGCNQELIQMIVGKEPGSFICFARSDCTDGELRALDALMNKKVVYVT